MHEFCEIRHFTYPGKPISVIVTHEYFESAEPYRTCLRSPGQYHATDSLERLVAEMTYYLSSGMLKTLLTHSDFVSDSEII